MARTMIQETTSSSAKLEIRDISLRFGGVNALMNVSLEIRDNEILSIIGPNGAGKTSLLNCISGYYKPQQGTMSFNGKKLGKLSIYQRTELGIARTFQKIELFNGLSALDNILAARHLHFNTGVLRTSLYYGKALREEVHHREVVEDILD